MPRFETVSNCSLGIACMVYGPRLQYEISAVTKAAIVRKRLILFLTTRHCRACALAISLRRRLQPLHFKRSLRFELLLLLYLGSLVGGDVGGAAARSMLQPDFPTVVKPLSCGAEWRKRGRANDGGQHKSSLYYSFFFFFILAHAFLFTDPFPVLRAFAKTRSRNLLATPSRAECPTT